MPAVTALTIDDFERLPAALAVGHELVEGQLIDVSGNTPVHNGLRDYLIEILRPHVRHGRLGRVYAEQEYDFGGNAHGPDVSFFGNEKSPLLDPGKRVQRFVPDLAIEIASPADTHEGFAAAPTSSRQTSSRAFPSCFDGPNKWPRLPIRVK